MAAGFWLVWPAVGGICVTKVLKGSSQAYGGFAAVIGRQAWLLMAAEITLMAGEVNVVLARRMWPRRLGGELGPPTSGRGAP